MEESINRGYRQLACAIVLQALDDYPENVFNEMRFKYWIDHYNSLEKTKANVMNRVRMTRSYNVAQRERILCEKFFTSEWCMMLMEYGMNLKDYDMTDITERLHEKGVKMFNDWMEERRKRK